ncbi:aminoglycoside phosphotransferase [Amycolatopsis roodepoortensis]|uniref:aminoglycoside phosphotransferase n=1 Tax=Amycolatopsis roodepoortensis TaxID=700274 RepID=UPI00214CD60A|nr:aminoglycoside phosphotransferase [Amycolatopsis roodepoortensis]UUV32334.1 aminoglycoside phosphotransferase [Amycolatopsis roodepoortensis]
MTIDDDATSQRGWLTGQLLAAADQVNGTLAGRPVFGWHDRTVGARIDTSDGPCWLRVTSEHAHWAGTDSWTGTSDATGEAFARVPKPELTDVREWQIGEQRVRAEVMTYVPDAAIADDMVLRNRVDLPPSWWTALADGLSAVAQVRDTKRVIIGDDVLRHRLLAAFGVDIDLDRLEWSCAHGDLHWGNLTAPSLWMLDWEHWGWAPRGYDTAVLYCASILQPDAADQVRAHFADQLDSYSGRVAQLAAVTKLLCRVEAGDHLDLAQPLHQHAASVLQQL